jgi:periplasmic protein TonB
VSSSHVPSRGGPSRPAAEEGPRPTPPPAPRTAPRPQPSTSPRSAGRPARLATQAPEAPHAPAPPLLPDRDPRPHGSTAGGLRLRAALSSRASLRTAIVLREVLGPPASLWGASDGPIGLRRRT